MHAPLPVSFPPARLAGLLLAVAALAVAGLLLHAEQADATHDPDATLHVCLRQNGTLMVGNTCGRNETATVLATGAGLDAAEARIAELERQVVDLEATNAELEARVGRLESILAGVTRTTDSAGRDTLQLAGMNVQVVNGEGATDTTNGLGNLIVGYHEDLTCDPTARDCPTYSDNAEDERTGSHMLVTGIDHTYTTFGGLLAGANNTTSGDWSSVSGGWSNVTNGTWASVVGGSQNTAGGDWSSVSGGSENTASGDWSSVLGGWSGVTNGTWASVVGGSENTAGGDWSSVSGGRSNEATGQESSILGGVGITIIRDEGCHPDC